MGELSPERRQKARWICMIDYIHEGVLLLQFPYLVISACALGAQAKRSKFGQRWHEEELNSSPRSEDTNSRCRRVLG